MIRIRVNGTPAPQGSKRAFRHKTTGRIVVTEMSKAVKPWRDAVQAEMQRWLNRDALAWANYQGAQWRIIDAEGALAVSITFILPRPRGHYGTGRNAATLKPTAPAMPATRPDLDKLVRSTLDGLKSGGAYGDDGQVAILSARKVYANGEAPGAVIEITAAGEAQHAAYCPAHKPSERNEYGLVEGKYPRQDGATHALHD